MREVHVTYKVYKYDELKQKSKDRAMRDFCEHNSYDFLEDQLDDELKYLLTQHGIEYDQLVLNYSLSYSQGDGVSFTGYFTMQNIEFFVYRVNNHYCHSKTVNFDYRDHVDEGYEELNQKQFDKFKSIYFDICKAIEKLGYDIIDYEQSEEYFKEHCESNEIEFLDNGKIFLG